MAIKLNGFDSSTPVSITEASLGIELGTLSGGTGEYELAFGDSWYTALFETYNSNSNSKKINGNTLRTGGQLSTVKCVWAGKFSIGKQTTDIILIESATAGRSGPTCFTLSMASGGKK